MAIEVAAKEAEESGEEWQAQLQVSTANHRDSSCTNICCAEGLGGIGDDAEPLLEPFTDKGKEVSTGVHLKLTLELRSGTGGPSGPTGSVLRSVQMASSVLHLAA